MADRGVPLPPFPTPPVPTDEVVGRPVAEVRELYLADGFRVGVVDLDDPNSVMVLSIAPDRIRLLAREGRVVRAVQG